MRRWLLCALALLLVLALPLSAQDDTTTLTVVAHDSFAFSEDVMAEFTEATGIAVEILRLGDTGTLVNQSVLTRGVPLGDVLFGVDNTFLSRALNADLFIPYESPLLENVPEEFQTGDEHRVTPVDYGDVCLNYDAAWFREADVPLPDSLAALTHPAYKGLLVVENPAASSPGLAFMLTTIGVFGEEGDYTWLDYWRDLRANDVLVVDSWTNAYYGEFSGSGGSEGTRPLVVSYASSPPVEVYFMEELPESAPTGVIAADDTCFRQIEYAGILHGADDVEAAQQFIDFLLSVPFQADLPLTMFVFPVNPDASLPDVFTEYADLPEQVVELDAEAIDANREKWLQAWTETVLR